MMGSKRVKLGDRISDLPDSMIHHILSFLPSTKEAIQTGILSKRWKNQWTQVPVLIFKNSTTSGMSYENFMKIIDNTLIQHESSKINKFHLHLSVYNSNWDPEINSIIGFATSKGVEDLNLYLILRGGCYYLLPELFFNNPFLVKLRIQNCSFIPNGKVNWGSLTVLSILYCKLTAEAIEHILSGCPLLKSLELDSCSGFDKVVITSKYLKRLVLQRYHSQIFVLQISCPNLEELSLDGMTTYDPDTFAQAIESVLSGCLLLESMSIQSINCPMIDKLVIASQSLKTLVVGNIHTESVFDIEISCPKLEKLKLFNILNVKAAKLLNLPSSLCATIDFQHHRIGELHTCTKNQTCKSLITDILQQLQHVKELILGNWFIEILSSIKMRGWFSPLLKVKCLTLDAPHFKKHHSGIARLLRISHVLEKLVINVLPNLKFNGKLGSDFWISNATVFNCLVSHLKTIKIVIGYRLLEKDVRYQYMLNLVRFLLNNSKVLEKMMVIVKDYGKGFPPEVSQELLSLPRCSQNVAIELLCSKEIGN